MKKNGIRLALLAVGLALTAAGIYLEQYRSVWMKAIRVCLECIGLG